MSKKDTDERNHKRYEKKKEKNNNSFQQYIPYHQHPNQSL